MRLGAGGGLGDPCFASPRRPRPRLSPSSPCVPVLLTATMDIPLASPLNLNPGTTGVPQNIHPMLSPSPRLVRADRCETRLSILHWPTTMIGGGVVSIIWRRRVALISRSLYPVHIYPLPWQIPYPRIPPHEKPWFASRCTSPVGKLFRRILRVDGGLSILR